jgi:Tol biopolymer transport system component
MVGERPGVVLPRWGEIVFTRFNPRTGTRRFVIMRLDGDPTRILVHQSIDRSEWAPDGRHIVFESENDDGLLTIRSDGTHRRRITNAPYGGGDFYPSYSSSGRSIFFTRELGEKGEKKVLMKVGAFGGNLRRVPAPPGFVDPAPAPEGVLYGRAVIQRDSDGGDRTLVLPRVRLFGYVARVGLILFNKDPIRVGLEHCLHIRDLVPGHDEEVGRITAHPLVVGAA